MNKLKNTTLVLCAIAGIALTPAKSEARHFHGGFRGHHHHHSFWGHGGRHFWPGFVGGVVGGALLGRHCWGYTTPVYTTPVYTTPVYTTPVVTAPTVQYVQQPVYTSSQQPQTVYVNSTTASQPATTTVQPKQQE